MTEHFLPDDDQLSYENFEDIDELAWDPDAVEPIDLAELDSQDDLETPTDAAEELLETIETLDDEIPPFSPSLPIDTSRISEDIDEDEDEGLTTGTEPEEEGPDELDQDVAEEPPPQPRTIRIGGRARMQRLPLPPLAARPPTGRRIGESRPAPAAPVDCVYRLLLTLPPELGAEVLELRELGEIDDMPPPGIDLAMAFRSADLDMLESAIESWARAHLPLELAVVEIVAEIIGAQQYVAAWRVEPHAALLDAQLALKRRLTPAIVPLAESLPVFQPRVIIGAHVPARAYPRVIGQMQRDFEPYTWHAESVALLRAAPDAAPGEWELVRTFGSPAGHDQTQQPE